MAQRKNMMQCFRCVTEKRKAPFRVPRDEIGTALMHQHLTEHRRSDLPKED